MEGIRLLSHFQLIIADGYYSVIQSAAYQFPTLVVGRFIGGIGIGILSSTAPMYISEIAPPNVRGSFLVLEAASIVFGIVVMFYIVSRV